METSRESLLKRITDLGVTGQAAKDLADLILNIPTKAQFTAVADTAAAEVRLQRIQDLINGIGATSDLHVSNGRGGGGMTTDDRPPGHAFGGTVYGPGTSKSDSVMRMLSVGEEVIQEPYASKYRSLLKQMNSGSYAPPMQYVGAPQGYGSGGGSSVTQGANVNMTVNGSPGMSAETVGRIAADQMNFALRGA